MKIHRSLFITILSFTPLLSCQEDAAPHNTALLIDTSGSITRESFSKVEADVNARALDFAKTNRPGDRFELYWFMPESSKHFIGEKSWRMPPLHPPAYKARKNFGERIKRDIHETFKDLPTNVSRTRILEAIHQIASAQDGPWSLIVLSDLNQDSPGWDEHGNALDGNPEIAIGAMLDLCPNKKVRNLPFKIELVTWPGLVRGRVDVQGHNNNKSNFGGFLEVWSPDSDVQIMHLK